MRLEERLKGADLCITGEGRLDASSMGGKTAIGVARICKRLGVKCVAVGSTGEAAEASLQEGLSAYARFSARDSVSSYRWRSRRLLDEVAGEVIMEL